MTASSNSALPRLPTISPESRTSSFAPTTAIKPGDLENADEVFITSTTRDLLPVLEIDGKKIRNAGKACASLKQAFGSEKVDTQDGIRIDWDANRSWVHARASNTEPIMRIIAEAPDRATADACIARVREVVQRAL